MSEGFYVEVKCCEWGLFCRNWNVADALCNSIYN